ncbi:hypothetical protein H6P81_015213 [Aristolochia fimbriata]|uniref:Uncharacterized protein n=1 Tax=Aristolochia fimbriata TaxID=158543 RepID=A0AAV7E4U8_ARIFI|nr:hypothetical protein H6P81_015213 [Aristolochia fimbriata]
MEISDSLWDRLDQEDEDFFSKEEDMCAYVWRKCFSKVERGGKCREIKNWENDWRLELIRLNSDPDWIIQRKWNCRASQSKFRLVSFLELQSLQSKFREMELQSLI